MPRWKPNPSERLASAALELFAQRGYERTTVAEIAERAGLTKSSFFRHFQDKREVLFGEDVMTGILVDGIAEAPVAAGPFEAIASGLDAVGSTVFVPTYREFSVRRLVVIAANPELQEREALKGLHLTDAMTDAINRRGVPYPAACVASQVGMLALTTAYERWSSIGNDEEFGDIARQALGELEAGTFLLTRTDPPGTEVPGFESRGISSSLADP